MRSTFKKGLGFGLTSGIITTLGLIVGLNSSTNSAKVVISGILIIAIADALSDSLGMHISEEAEGVHSTKEIWESTLATFVSKFVFALTFLVPTILLPLSTAVIVSIIWGISLIGIFSFYIASDQKISPKNVVFEHMLIAICVIIGTNYVGILIKSILG
jgi:vacuolar iron transporter family protein